MGTFHQNKGELHGITVVVETTGPDLFVGRCDTVTDDAVILLDADVHREGTDDRSREEYLKRAVQFGVWKKHDRLAIARSSVKSLRRLGEVEV